MYIGAADYVAEINDKELLVALETIWNDMYNRKASFTGGLGNVHRGGSETPRNATECVHEAFGFPYQLQNSTAYNETCATFYGAYYSWRLFMLTGNPMYLDVMEKAFYNNLSSMGLDGKSYFYTNVLRWYGKQHPLLSLDFIRDGLKNALAFVVLQAWCVSWLKQKIMLMRKMKILFCDSLWK